MPVRIETGRMTARGRRTNRLLARAVHCWLIAAILCAGHVRAQDRPVDFVDAASAVPGLQEDIRYAGSHNFTGRPINGYEAPRCLLTREAATALAEVARDLSSRGLHIKVFDCYRPTR